MAVSFLGRCGDQDLSHIRGRKDFPSSPPSKMCLIFLKTMDMTIISSFSFSRAYPQVAWKPPELIHFYVPEAGSEPEVNCAQGPEGSSLPTLIFPDFLLP